MLSPSSLSEMLAGRTPEALYDALHARRCLSDRALSHPDEVLDFLGFFFRTSRQAAFLPRLAEALGGSLFLNEEGRQLADAEPTDEWTRGFVPSQCCLERLVPLQALILG
jgi:hypothetical protein